MHAAPKALTVDPPGCTSSAMTKSESWHSIEVLEELLAHSIHLRDMYKNARWQAADVQIRGLHELFDVHYKDQIRLVDTLLDRIRALNGAGRVFAGDFLHPTRFSQLRRGRASTARLLGAIVDAHDYVLNAALPTRESEGQVNRSWTQDFAVGQVVLTNDQQVLAVREQLTHLRDVADQLRLMELE